ncbi:selenium metabolism-associated LysR family transcriptional regulator [Bacillus suaedae]|uniref:LysR family transcriptional regulator n=1 Tax=Halalkalibacter suaedae TaxID=2822140 RepID=A0A941ANB6_9BACI|nr:selenium metabolism-associated LysR family transcriptional regulator [Bacillus suaedae]MBP3950696.1 LysR family transcriptional regulator [Bacillus suaedae]
MLDQLKLFVTVVEQRHFSKAAKLLNVTQPNVSLQIRRLEEEFGTTLFVRSPKRVQVTDSGELLYLKAKKILSLYEQAKQEIEQQQVEIKGVIKIGASFTIGEYILPRILAEFANQYTEVKVEVFVGNTEEVIEKINKHELDIGLVEGQVNSNIRMYPFMEDELILIAPPNHEYAQLRSIKPEMLDEQVWILREKGSGTREYCDRFFSDFSLKLQHLFIFSSSQGIKEAVSAGLGIAMISKLTVKKELEYKEIKQLYVQNQNVTRTFHLIEPENLNASKARELFKQAILSQRMA